MKLVPISPLLLVDVLMTLLCRLTVDRLDSEVLINVESILAVGVVTVTLEPG